MNVRAAMLVVLLLAFAPAVHGQDGAPEEAGWSAAALPSTARVPALVAGVAAGPDSVVAIGRHTCELQRGELGGCWGQPWISEDGRTWEAVDARTSGLDLGRFQDRLHGPPFGLDGIAHGPAGFVAYGWAVPEAELGTKAERRGRATVEPTLWHSDDGISWSRLPSPAGFSTQGLMVTGPWLSAIAGTESGYVLAGTIYDAPTPRAAVWFSTDGLEWEPAGPDAAFDVGAYIDTMEIPAVGGIAAFTTLPPSATGSGGLIAVGSACPPAEPGAGPKDAHWRTWDWTTGSCRARIWRSDDGRTWRAGDLEGASGSPVEAYLAETVATTGDASVVGVYPRQVLYSDEGSVWTASPNHKIGRQRALAASDAGFHAFVPKCQVEECRRRTLAAWSSVDGAEWTLDASQPVLPVSVDEFIDVDATRFGDRTIVTSSYFPTRGGDWVSVALLSPSRSATP